MRALKPLIERRSQTMPAGTLESPSEGFLQVYGGGQTSSTRVSVSERTADAIPTVFACDLVIKQDLAKCPLKIKRINTDNTRADDINNPVYYALHEQFNPVMTAYEGKETLQGYLNLWGNAFAEIIWLRDEVQLWPLDASRMTVDLDPLNRLRYAYAMSSGVPKTWIYDPAKPPILHLRQNTRDGIHGRSVIQVLREGMGLALAQDRFIGRFYGQGGHPRVALSTSQKLNEASARRIREDFESVTVGEHNWHRVVVLDHDLKPVPLVMPNRDAQFLELVRLGDQRICGSFRVPPHKVADLERATFSNIEHQGIAYVNDCLMPHFTCWQQAIRRDLLNPRSYSTFAVFVVDALVRGDMATTNAALNIQRQNGVISANDWRRALDMDDQIAAEDGGDELLVQGAMMPMRRESAIAFENPTPTPPPQPPAGGVH